MIIFLLVIYYDVDFYGFLNHCQAHPSPISAYFSFAGLRLALYLIKPPTTTRPPNRESSEQAEKCVATVKVELFEHMIALIFRKDAREALRKKSI